MRRCRIACGDGFVDSLVVGRSTSPIGPYEDRDGKDMMDGGGFPVLHASLDRTGRFAGPGHPAILKQESVGGQMTNSGCPYGDKAGYAQVEAYLKSLGGGR